jgi:hypothetical protein
MVEKQEPVARIQNPVEKHDSYKDVDFNAEYTEGRGNKLGVDS